jgi:hypothetical protein
MQLGHGHVACSRTWACCTDMDMQHEHVQHLQHGHGHMDMDIDYYWTSAEGPNAAKDRNNVYVDTVM